MKRLIRSPLAWGATALAVVVIVCLVVAWVYVNPPAQQKISFYTDDALSVSTGDTVRVAGVVVGKVEERALENDRVRIQLSVDKSVFIGDQSQVQVRMLTVVGGYYVTIVPLGDRPLGGSAIPVDRVTMPYSLIRTLADTTKITQQVAPQPIQMSIDQIQNGLTGDNTNALTQILAAGNTITQMMERQRGQLTRILEGSNEYIKQLNDNRDLLQYLIKRIAILEETLVLYGQGFAAALDGMGQIVTRVGAINDFYMPRRVDFLNRVRGILGEFQAIADRNGVVVRVLRRIRDRMENTLDAQDNGTPPELLATDLCVPTEGARC